MSKCLCGWSEWCKYCDPFKSDKEEFLIQALEQKLAVAVATLEWYANASYGDIVEDEINQARQALALIKPDAQKAGVE